MFYSTTTYGAKFADAMQNDPAALGMMILIAMLGAAAALSVVLRKKGGRDVSPYVFGAPFVLAPILTWLIWLVR